MTGAEVARRARPEVPVAAGEFSSGERHEIDRAIRAAEQSSRYEFSVYVGRAEGDPLGRWPADGRLDCARVSTDGLSVPAVGLREERGAGVA